VIYRLEIAESAKAGVVGPRSGRMKGVILHYLHYDCVLDCVIERGWLREIPANIFVIFLASQLGAASKWPSVPPRS
jgi:hypothetical protein